LGNARVEMGLNVGERHTDDRHIEERQKHNKTDRHECEATSSNSSSSHSFLLAFLRPQPIRTTPGGHHDEDTR
jgi:hypothetical protein